MASFDRIFLSPRDYQFSVILPKPLPKRLGPNSFEYKRLTKQLHEYWLKRLQNQSDQHAQPTSIFNNEKALIQALFDFPANPYKKVILKFCNTLLANTQGKLLQQNALSGSASLDLAKEQIGQIIFLSDQNLKAVAALLDINDIPNSIKRVQKAFDKEIQIVLNRIETRRALHDKVPLQDSALSLSIQKPLAIATILTTSSGLLNLGLVDALKKRFFNLNSSLLQYEKELIQTLDDLKQSPEMQQQIQSILKPFSPCFFSNDIIRVTLNLPPQAIPTDQQVKTIVLAALLSDMRQGDIGSCFAASVSILMMGALKNKVLDDLIHIISEGKITRPGLNKSFFPVIDIEDSALQNKITIDADCKMLAGNGYLWEAPGIISACQQMNLTGNQVESSVRTAIKILYAQQGLNLTELIEVSPQLLINKLIQNDLKLKQLTENQLRDTHNLALLAFLSENNTPLLSAWESCLAEIATAHDHYHLRKKIINSVSDAINSKWPANYFSGLTKEAEKVKTIVQRMLDTGAQIRFDEEIAYKSPYDDESKPPQIGAYVLYELKRGDRSIAAKKIESPEDFRGFVSNRIKVSHEVLDNIKYLPNRQKHQQILNKIQAVVNSEDRNYTSFLSKVIRYYDEDNKNLLEPLQNWEEIKHLPFRDFTNESNLPANNKVTRFSAGQPEIVRPKNSFELLESFITIEKNHIQSDNFIKNNNCLVNSNLPQYSFKLTPDDPSIIEAMLSAQSASEWIHQNIIEPGKAIANFHLSDAQKELFIRAVASQIVPPELVSSFTASTKVFDLTKNSVHLFSNQILQLLYSMSSRQDETMRSALSTSLTTILLQEVLPQAVTNTLRHTAARIAETNWIDNGVHHLYFACYFDPITHSLQLCTINEDGHQLRPLDQLKWVSYIPWEMYGIKIIPSLSNHKMELLTV